MSGCWSLRGARRTPHASGKRASDPCPSRRGRPSQWASNLLMFERHGRSGARTIFLALVRSHIPVSVVGAQRDDDSMGQRAGMSHERVWVAYSRTGRLLGDRVRMVDSLRQLSALGLRLAARLRTPDTRWCKKGARPLGPTLLAAR